LKPFEEIAMPKKNEPKVYNPELKIGETDDSKATVECSDCNNVNFLVQIEPDYEGNPRAKGNFEYTSKRVQFCPFCGGENLSEV
jgi:Zn finger protein HypA/HybF involved in hydrogenase expression